jgi:hypothetical protein
VKSTPDPKVEPAPRRLPTPATAAPKSPSRPAASKAKASEQVAAVVPHQQPTSPPRPAVKPPPAPKRADPAEPREVLKALPAPEEPPPVRKAAVPQVFVERTVWHPLADRRVAMVSLGKEAEAVELREGDALGPYVVGEIEPTGVFFYQGDEELRRRVGDR